MKTAVVILNWNGKKHLEKFLPSVVVNSNDATIIVADNASTDDSVSFLKENYPAIEIILNTENYGFAGGYNEALQHVKSDYYVLLNSDVEVPENWLSPLVETLSSSEDIVACQPKILAYADKTKFEHAGAAGGFIDRYGFPFCRGRIFHEVETDSSQYDIPTEIFWATGACMAIKANAFHEQGGFDADFFAHMEEIDLCWRMKNEGHKVMYVPSSTVYHLGGGTLDYMSPFKTYLNFRNNLFMLIKNQHYHFVGVFLFRMCLDGVAGVKFLLEGKPIHTFQILKAHFHFYTKFPSMWSKRKLLYKKSPNPNLSGVYKKSIVLRFFLKKTVKNFTDIHSKDIIV